MRLHSSNCSVLLHWLRLSVCMSVSESVYVREAISSLHELPVGNHDLRNALQRLGLDGRIFIADHSQGDVFA